MATKLSYAQERYLKAIADGIEPWLNVRGQAAHGGLESTRMSLLRRGLLGYESDGKGGPKREVLTDAGRAAVEAAKH